MTDRAAAEAAFLDATGWRNATRTPLAGDASTRRYTRLRRGDDTAILMDTPPDRGQDIRPFTRIARYLAAAGFSAPAILGEDAEAGLLLLEDLGDALFARIVGPVPEALLYTAATDVLLALHRGPPPDLARWTPADMAAMIEPLFGFYARVDPSQAATIETALAEALERLAPYDHVLALRDYHAENLIWLPDRAGVGRVGLLDFQDAFLGHPAYDLVSLLRDARRDVGEAAAAAAMARFAEGAGMAEDALRHAAAALSAQRNLRILGIFARLSLQDGKPRYLDLVPRVWRYIEADLEHPRLADLRRLVRALVPPPTAAHLATLKAPCPTVPTP